MHERRSLRLPYMAEELCRKLYCIIKKYNSSLSVFRCGSHVKLFYRKTRNVVDQREVHTKKVNTRTLLFSANPILHSHNVVSHSFNITQSDVTILIPYVGIIVYSILYILPSTNKKSIIKILYQNY